MMSLNDIPTIGLECFSDDRLDRLGDYIRFCMTDKVMTSINVVVETDTTPMEYARILVDHDFDTVHREFFSDRVNPLQFDNIIGEKGLDRLIAEAYIYDYTIIAASVFRLSQFRYMTTESITDGGVEDSNIFSSTLLYLTTLFDSNCVYSHYSGLSEFKSICDLFINALSYSKEGIEIGFMDRFSSNVSIITKTDWILYDPIWGDVLLGHPHRLKKFRQFLYIAVIGNLFDEMFMTNMFSTTRDKLELDMLAFIDLREDKTTNKQDVIDFLRSIEKHTSSFIENMIFYSLLQLPFSTFKEYYLRSNSTNAIDGGVEDSNPLESLNDSFHTHLSELWNPDEVISGDITPVDYVHQLYTEHRDIILQGPIKQHYIDLQVPVSDDVDTQTTVVSGSIKDYSLLALLYARYKHIDPTDAFYDVKNTAHLLLILEDESIGFSVISWVLPFHAHKNAHKLNDDQIEIINEMMNVLDEISISFTTQMDRHWVDLLDDLEVRTHLRAMFFMIMESFYIENDDDYEKHVDISKDEFYDFLQLFTKTISEDCTKSELMRTLEKAPVLLDTAMINERDFLILTGKFSDIPTTEEPTDET